ncbi:hypothetical protein BKA66DRAFT_608346 [Pyrenochaeta sp. MPI-SDFR-AT-0127]|nr:hypothetical protein BKA66DRAFT_608346 [Pyrenochaeta sp. MPI-SDFR-AT-0127]
MTQGPLERFEGNAGSQESHSSQPDQISSENNERQEGSVENPRPPSTPFDYAKFGIATALAGTVNHRSQALNILMVDFDSNSSIAQELLAAYQCLISPSFPTFVFRNANEFHSPQDLIDVVREEKYWAAIYVTSGASQRLSAAIPGNSSIYKPNSALAYVWNQIRYPATTGAVVVPSLLQIISATQTAYHMANGQRDLRLLSTFSSGEAPAAAVKAFLNPVGATPIKIRPAA